MKKASWLAKSASFLIVFDDWKSGWNFSPHLLDRGSINCLPALLRFVHVLFAWCICPHGLQQIQPFSLSLCIHTYIYIYYIYNYIYTSLHTYYTYILCNYVVHILFGRDFWMLLATHHINWPLPNRTSTPGKHWSRALAALPPDATASARNAVVSACGIAWEKALSFPTTSGGSFPAFGGGGSA